MSQNTKNSVGKWPKSALNSLGEYTPLVFVYFSREVISTVHASPDHNPVYSDRIKTIEKLYVKKQVHAGSVVEAIKRVESDFYEVYPSNFLRRSDPCNPAESIYTMYLRKWTDREITAFKMRDLCD